jgi:hypothetical protein
MMTNHQQRGVQLNVSTGNAVYSNIFNDEAVFHNFG